MLNLDVCAHALNSDGTTEVLGVSQPWRIWETRDIYHRHIVQPSISYQWSREIIQRNKKKEQHFTRK